MATGKEKKLKKDILLTIAGASDFSAVRSKLPHVSDSFIKSTLIEAALFFNNDKEAEIVMPKVNSPLTMNVDGASKGNPGISAAGVIIRDASGNEVAEVKKYLGVMTNNKAEYSALVIGLKEALKINTLPITVYMDSELVVKQIKGEYKIKNEELRILNESASNLLKKFDGYNIIHVMRSENQHADKLANEAIKEHLKSE